MCDEKQGWVNDEVTGAALLSPAWLCIRAQRDSDKAKEIQGVKVAFVIKSFNILKYLCGRKHKNKAVKSNQNSGCKRCN